MHISDHDITTPGDACDVLVAMNPAALRADLGRLRRGGMLIVNTDTFDERNLAKAGYATNPLDDGSLAAYKLAEVPMTTLTKEATAAARRQAPRRRPVEELLRPRRRLLALQPARPRRRWRGSRSASPTTPLVRDANRAAYLAGFNFGETDRAVRPPLRGAARADAPRASTPTSPATPRWPGGWSPPASWPTCRVTLGSYPITPASDILHELAKHKNFGVRTFQAEDEIAACGAALGAAFAGHLGVTTTSGPGVALKSETMSLAISLELPLLLVDIQRGGPSTGLPTKTEAADLLIALYGRHAEAPLPVVAAFSPSHCFFAAIEAARLALKYRTPVILLSDGYLANGAEPWRLPDVADLPDISVPFATEPNHVNDDGTIEFWPYLRDPDTLARPWAIPGTPGLQHRIGGLEKEDGTGNIDYTPENHEQDGAAARRQGRRHRQRHPARRRSSGDEDAELLVVGWGSTWAAIDAAVQQARRRGRKVAWTHLVHLNPLPANLGDIVRRYPKILVPELNLGQLSRCVRAEYLVDATAAHQGAGPALHRHRDRGRHRGDARR